MHYHQKHILAKKCVNSLFFNNFDDLESALGTTVVLEKKCQMVYQGPLKSNIDIKNFTGRRLITIELAEKMPISKYF